MYQTENLIYVIETVNHTSTNSMIANAFTYIFRYIRQYLAH